MKKQRAEKPLPKNRPTKRVGSGTMVRCRVCVYLDDGRVYEYEVANPSKGREHASAIVQGGYRTTDNQAGEMEHYPPHRILKVKVSGGVQTMYPDAQRGT